MLDPMLQTSSSPKCTNKDEPLVLQKGTVLIAVNKFKEAIGVAFRVKVCPPNITHWKVNHQINPFER